MPFFLWREFYLCFFNHLVVMVYSDMNCQCPVCPIYNPHSQEFDFLITVQ